MHIVIFSGGDFTLSKLSQKALQSADIVIAADSGADTAIRLHIIPHVVVGDYDSITPDTQQILKTKETQFIDMPTTLVSLPKGSTQPLNTSEKDQTDTELAIDYALQHNATEITILGGLAGDRFDHIIANLFLTTTTDVPIQFINGNQISWIGKGPYKKDLSGQKGDLLSLIPISSVVEEITTEGLYYPLKNDQLVFGKPRGISNVLVTSKVTVSFTCGVLLLIHTHF